MTLESRTQFDDDLTVGMDDGNYATESIDLFEFTGDEESPVARLKTIILSLDWEINDDILHQLDEELVDLNDIWAGDKIKQVYVQGLSKIGKYIYKEKANSHPNAIKLLITFFHNLEKIVSSDDLMSDDDKKQLLLRDVKTFEQLKKEIERSGAEGLAESDAASVPEIQSEPVINSEEIVQLKDLKAYILGLDWEIDDQELKKLDGEVRRLEEVFSQNKAKLILLQGIGALISYINKMRSQSNSNAFTLLHSFFGTLETISASELPVEEQKQLLLAEVEKFNSFKSNIASAQSEPAEDIAESSPIAAMSDGPATASGTPSAFVGVDDGNVVEDENDAKVAADVESRLADVFGDEQSETSPFADENDPLEGVNVECEADDDSDEEALPFEGDTVAPALADVEEASSFSVEKLAEDLAVTDQKKTEVADVLPAESVLQGVDVETEADDDSDEATLPFEDGELAPALSGSSADSGFDEKIIAKEIVDSDSEDLENRLDSFFDDDVQPLADEVGTEEEADLFMFDNDNEPSSHGIDARVDEPNATDIDELSFLDDDNFPVAETSSPGTQLLDNEQKLESDEGELSFFDEDAPTPALSGDPVALSDSDEIDFTVPGEEPVASHSSTGEIEDVGLEKAFQRETDISVVEDTFEEELSFLGEDEPTLADDNGLPSVDNVVFDDSIESSTTQTLSTVVPGAIATTTLAATAVAGTIAQKKSELVDDLTLEDSEEVVFEVMADDVAVDPLPGEEFVDSAPIATISSQESITSNVDTMEAMGSTIASLQKNVTVDELQNLVSQIDQSRNLTPSNHSDIFLELLSTICQHVKRNMNTCDAGSFTLMDEVYSGIKMSLSDDYSTPSISQHLLMCTTKVLHMQEKEIERT